MRKEPTYLAITLYYTILHLPTSLAVLLIYQLELKLWLKTLIVLFAITWSHLGILIVNMTGVLEHLLGMELVIAEDRQFLLTKSIMTPTIKMDAPDDLEQFS